MDLLLHGFHVLRQLLHFGACLVEIAHGHNRLVGAVFFGLADGIADLLVQFKRLRPPVSERLDPLLALRAPDAFPASLFWF